MVNDLLGSEIHHKFTGSGGEGPAGVTKTSLGGRKTPPTVSTLQLALRAPWAQLRSAHAKGEGKDGRPAH